MAEALQSGGDESRRGSASRGGLPWWFGVPFLLGGLFVLAIGAMLLLDELRYGSEGVAVQGVVVEPIYYSGGAEDGPSWAIRYEFTDPLTGRSHTGQSDVSEETYDAAFPGDPIEVTYLPAEPGKSRIGSPDPQLLIPLIVLGAGVLFGIVGLGLLALTRWLRKNTAPSWVQVSGNSVSLNLGVLGERNFAGLTSAALAAAQQHDHAGHDHAGHVHGQGQGGGAAVSAFAEPVMPPPPPAAPQAPTTEADLRTLDAKFAAPAAPATPLAPAAPPPPHSTAAPPGTPPAAEDRP